MRKWRITILTCTLLGLQANMAPAQNTPGPKAPRPGRVAWSSDPLKRCPDLRVAGGGPAAVVLFRVGRSGVSSQASIKSSSGSQSLDDAAVGCVLKLRFEPEVRLGDGETVDSWQEMAWEWASQTPDHHDTQAGTASAAVAPPEPPPVVTGSTAAAAPPASAKQDRSHREDSKVAVRVCADDTGRLVHDPAIVRSSGNPGLDQAAIAIAKSGSAYYHPETTVGGKPVSGCAQLVIDFETR